MADRETGRVEAFSDGVFAIAITLLVLDLKVPPREVNEGQRLGAALLAHWPSYLAYLTSFATILIMWVNHHRIFTLVGRIDDRLLFYNGLLLLGVSVAPFPTSLVSEYLGHDGERLAAVIFNGTYVYLAICFNLLWHTCATRQRLLHNDADAAAVRAITKAFRLGPVGYVLALVLAFVNVTASVGLNLALALYYALPSRGEVPPAAGSTRSSPTLR
jgi:uncharacterized membrane protein